MKKAQTGCIVDHLLVCETEIEHLVEQCDHKTTVAAATTHTGLCRYALVEMGMDTGQSGEVGLEQIIYADHQIALFVAIDGDIGYLQVAVVLGRKLWVHRVQLECILDLHGIEHRLEVVITVGAFLDYIKTEIDLCYWPC